MFFLSILQPKNEMTNIPFGIMLSGDVNTWEFAEWNKRSFKYRVVNQEKKRRKLRNMQKWEIIKRKNIEVENRAGN